MGCDGEELSFSERNRSSRDRVESGRRHSAVWGSCEVWVVDVVPFANCHLLVNILVQA